MKKLVASLIDSILVFGFGAVLLILTILIMKVIGFEFYDQTVTAWAYAVACGIASLIYYPITESTKMDNTIGKKLLGVGPVKKATK